MFKKMVTGTFFKKNSDLDAAETKLFGSATEIVALFADSRFARRNFNIKNQHCNRHVKILKCFSERQI